MTPAFVCTYWGCENLSASEFLDKALEAGYDGVEINLPENETFISEFLAKISFIRMSVNPEFIWIAQQVLPPANESFKQYVRRYEKRLFDLAGMKPNFINSHTGKDYYTFEENSTLIEMAMSISGKSGVKIMHETHRGRFTFHASSLLAYLSEFPTLELVGDLSHWCTVSESLLEDQEETIKKIIPHIAHIHARVGQAHSPQVNDPSAPEWENNLNRFMQWWETILNHQKQKDKSNFTICPEFGPIPYMPTAPYSNRPLGNQWQINLKMKEMLKQKL